MHCGARGQIPNADKEKLRNLMNEGCVIASNAIKSGEKDAAISAVTLALEYLENSPLTNAGYGSNLTKVRPCFL